MKEAPILLINNLYFCEKRNSLQQDAAGTLSEDEAESTLVIAVEAVFQGSAVPQRPA